LYTLVHFFQQFFNGEFAMSTMLFLSLVLLVVQLLRQFLLPSSAVFFFLSDLLLSGWLSFEPSR
jgi:hypothetical protein